MSDHLSNLPFFGAAMQKVEKRGVTLHSDFLAMIWMEATEKYTSHYTKFSEIAIRARCAGEFSVKKL